MNRGLAIDSYRELKRLEQRMIEKGLTINPLVLDTSDDE
jgi:hypothetical protein